jgi:hypothetical protein
MHALAFLLGSRALDVARSSAPAQRPRDEVLPPIASTPETAAAWRRWRQAGTTTKATPRPDVVFGNRLAKGNPG